MFIVNYKGIKVLFTSNKGNVKLVTVITAGLNIKLNISDMISMKLYSCNHRSQHKKRLIVGLILLEKCKKMGLI